MSDDELLADSLDELESVGCQFWACKGPTLNPIDMVTCNLCRLIAVLRNRLNN